MIEFVPVEQEHIEFIAANMREADAVEVWHSSMQDPLTALTRSVDYSFLSSAAMCDGVPLVAYGLVNKSLLDQSGVPWMLGTNQALRHKRGFLTETPKVIDTHQIKIVQIAFYPLHPPCIAAFF